MRITEAAQRLGTSPRMLRYRDMLGLLPPVRESLPGPGRAGSGRPRPGRPRAHRRFGEDDLAAVAHALRIERRYDISPAALAFGLKVLTEPGIRAEVAELGRRVGRIASPPARALDFEQQRALRLLRLPPGRGPSGGGPETAPPGSAPPGSAPPGSASPGSASPVRTPGR